ncbi:unnamed protein product, partial [Tetraodon nigroviridis]
QAVEMDIELSHFPKTRTDDSQWGDLTPPLVTMETESPHPPDDGTLAEPQLEVKGRGDEEEKSHLCPPAPAEDAITHQEEVGKHEGVVSSLRSFIPQEESSGLEEDMSLEAKHEEEEQIEDDYEVFDAEEERQARLAAELQGLDWFCFTCGDLLSKDERASEEHRNHEVADVDAAYEQIKVNCDIMGRCRPVQGECLWTRGRRHLQVVWVSLCGLCLCRNTDERHTHTTSVGTNTKTPAQHSPGKLLQGPDLGFTPEEISPCEPLTACCRPDSCVMV